MEIKLEHVNKTYRRKQNPLLVLNDINLAIESGTFLSILGPSGSGKSTLLHIIAGLLEPTEGSILYDDKNIRDLSEQKKSEIRNTRLGIITQNSGLIPYLTVSENICLPDWISTGKRTKEKREERNFAAEILEKVGIQDLIKEYPRNLSGGEKKRVVIARALCNNPEVVIADEPTANLDMDNVERVLKLFRELADQGKTVIMATHEKEAIHYSDETMELNVAKAMWDKIYCDNFYL